MIKNDITIDRGSRKAIIWHIGNEVHYSAYIKTETPSHPGGKILAGGMFGGYATDTQEAIDICEDAMARSH